MSLSLIQAQGMMMSKSRIHVIDDINWPFKGSPYVSVESGLYTRNEDVDPFPCYSHDLTLARSIIKHVEASFPMGYKPHYNMLAFETLERVNGWADKVYNHQEKKKQPWYPYITISGKRIPIHPAMTRYVIAHEYGHIVEWWIEKQLGYEAAHNILETEYAKMRGISDNKAYGGGKWASNPGEVFANDFRIVVCGLEEEFWPHDVTHPLKVKKVQKWWDDAVKNCSIKSNK